MDATFTKRDLIEPKRLRSLMQRSDLRGWLQLGSHAGAILLTGMLLWQTWGTWATIPLFMLHGVLTNFLYAGQHELSHETVFATKWLNPLFGRIIGFLMLFPRDFDKIQHWAHHQHTQNWEKDGELAREPYTLKSYLLLFWGPTYWYTRVTRILRLARGVVIEPYIRPDQHHIVIREARILMAGYAVIAVLSLLFQTWAAVILWLAPMMVMKFVHQMQNTIEHLGLSHENDILKNTRSTRTNPIMKWLCWQMPYHTAHHSFPSVPFWRLKELDQEIKTSGAEPYAMGWIEFQIEILRKLAAKDEDNYPYDEVWIVSHKGRTTRVEAA